MDSPSFEAERAEGDGAKELAPRTGRKSVLPRRSLAS